GFGYTTASHTLEMPRERAILELTRPVTRDEGIRLCKALAHNLHVSFGGAIELDEAAFRGEQPIFTPLHGAQILRYDGAVLNVDVVLATAPEEQKPSSTGTSDDEKIPVGSRNDKLFRLGCAMRRHGADEVSILDALRRENNRRC